MIANAEHESAQQKASAGGTQPYCGLHHLREDENSVLAARGPMAERVSAILLLKRHQGTSKKSIYVN